MLVRISAQGQNAAARAAPFAHATGICATTFAPADASRVPDMIAQSPSAPEHAQCTAHSAELHQGRE